MGEPEALQEQGLAFNNACYCQARSYKFAMGGCFGGKAPTARGMEIWGRRPQHLKILHFFAKITQFLAIVIDML